MDFIISLLLVISPNETKKDTILVIVNYYTKINKFFAVLTNIKS
jgi:hypothetical protein